MQPVVGLIPLVSPDGLPADARLASGGTADGETFSAALAAARGAAGVPAPTSSVPGTAGDESFQTTDGCPASPELSAELLACLGPLWLAAPPAGPTPPTGGPAGTVSGVTGPAETPILAAILPFATEGQPTDGGAALAMVATQLEAEMTGAMSAPRSGVTTMAAPAAPPAVADLGGAIQGRVIPSNAAIADAVPVAPSAVATMPGGLPIGSVVGRLTGSGVDGVPTAAIATETVFSAAAPDGQPVAAPTSGPPDGRVVEVAATVAGQAAAATPPADASRPTLRSFLDRVDAMAHSAIAENLAIGTPVTVSASASGRVPLIGPGPTTSVPTVAGPATQPVSAPGPGRVDELSLAARAEEAVGRFSELAGLVTGQAPAGTMAVQSFRIGELTGVAGLPLAEQLARGAEIAASRPGQSVRLVLQPEGLGTVTLKVDLHQHGVGVHIAVDNPATRELVQATWVQLQQALDHRGIVAQSLQVDVSDSQASSGQTLSGQSWNEGFRQAGGRASWGGATASQRSDQVGDAAELVGDAARSSGVGDPTRRIDYRV